MRWASGVVEVVKYFLCQHVLEVVVWFVHCTRPVHRVQWIGTDCSSFICRIMFHSFTASFVTARIALVHMHATSNTSRDRNAMPSSVACLDRDAVSSVLEVFIEGHWVIAIPDRV